MRTIEEKNLKAAITKFNKWIKKNDSFSDFFNDCTKLELKSLQELSFKNDEEFFEEIKHVMSIIATIIHHPHLSNREREIIVRADQAANMTQDMFNKTMRNSELWSEKNLKMVPEYVYYSEHVDELRIYENIFIGHLIDKIQGEIDTYKIFYSRMVKSFFMNRLVSSFNDARSLNIDSDTEFKLLTDIKELEKRLRFIKSTRFYKEVSGPAKKITKVVPTNILISDRLYNYCYKFYKEQVSYTDNTQKLRDIRTYYWILLLQQSRNYGMKLPDGFQTNKQKFTYDEDGNVILPEALLMGPDFSVKMEINDKYNGLVFEVINRACEADSKIAKHLLLFNALYRFDIYKEMKFPDEYLTVEALSLWNLYQVDNQLLVNLNVLDEKGLLEKYFETKEARTQASKTLYSTYCPSCKSNRIVHSGTKHICQVCKSVYTFYKNENKDILWFLKFRRR